jgi:hypothetical protein
MLVADSDYLRKKKIDVNRVRLTYKGVPLNDK